MTTFMLKIIALTTMILDHLEKSGVVSQLRLMEWFGLSITSSFALIESFQFLGRIAFPIYAFLISEGCRRTRDINRYIARLLIFGMISEIPFDLALDPLNQIGAQNYRISFFSHMNIFFTLALGAIAIATYRFVTERYHKKWLSVVPITICLVVGALADVDYSWLGVLLIVSAYLPMTKWRKVLSMTLVLATLYLGYGSYWFQSFTVWNIVPLLGSIVSLGFIFLYNGEQGPRMKWLFYCAYPAHLMLLFAIRLTWPA